MAKGLKLPVGVTPSGKTAMADGDEENRKVIYSALSDCDNEHAFQQNLGLGSAMIFDVADTRGRAKVMARIISVFEKFEAAHRYKLRTDTVRWTQKRDSGELILEFLYHDLESDEEQPFARTFRV